jgi:release factor glutamine methyltransferase
LLAPLSGSPVDAIVSNPPYVTGPEWAALDSGVRDHEPRIALVSPEDGMAHTRTLLVEARPLISEGGLFAIEVDSTRAEQALAFAHRCGWVDARLERDLFGRLRYLLATKESG